MVPHFLFLKFSGGIRTARDCRSALTRHFSFLGMTAEPHSPDNVIYFEQTVLF